MRHQTGILEIEKKFHAIYVLANLQQSQIYGGMKQSVKLGEKLKLFLWLLLATEFVHVLLFSDVIYTAIISALCCTQQGFLEKDLLK